MKTLILSFVLFVLFVANAYAQKDALRMGESLNANIIRKTGMKEIKSGKTIEAKKPQPLRTKEALEIETKKQK